MYPDPDPRLPGHAGGGHFPQYLSSTVVLFPGRRRPVKGYGLILIDAQRRHKTGSHHTAHRYYTAAPPVKILQRPKDILH